jgi:WD40 repeat protein
VLLLDARTLRTTPLRLDAPDGRAGWIGTDLAFSKDGHHLAAAVRRLRQAGGAEPGPDSLVAVAAVALVWDLRDGGPPARVRLEGKDWQSVALSPHGSRLYTSSPLVEHDLVRGGDRVLDGRRVGSLAMGRDGRRLVTVLGGKVLVEDVRTGSATRVDSALDVAGLRLAGDGRTLLLVDWNDRRAEVWRVAGAGARLRTTVDLDRGAAGAVDFAADGSFLYSTSGGSDLRRWDLTGEREFVRRDRVAGERQGGVFAVMAPGGEREVFIPWDGLGFGVHDLETGDRSRVIPWGEGYRHTVGAWHPDGRHYATAVGDRLRIWDLRTATRVDGAVLPGPQVTEIDYTDDGTRLAVAELDGRITMLSTRTWQPVGRPVEVGQHVSWVQTRPDNRTAVVLTGGPSTSQLRIAASPGWALVDLEEGRVLARGSLGMAHGTWLGISPDGRYAAVSGGSLAENVDPTGADGKLAVIDLRAGSLVRPPVVAHQGVAFQLAYSPDGSRILTTGLDGTVALWDATEGTLLGRITIEGRPYAGVAFSADGRSARIVEWWTGRVWTWPLDIDQAVAYACRAAGRDLTREEWRDHFGDRPYEHVCAS